MTPTDVCNLALSEIGQQVTINSLNDNSPAARACKINYTPRIEALLRSVNWNVARAQTWLTLYKRADSTGTGDPIGISFTIGQSPIGGSQPQRPPQPSMYEYLLPSDCLDARFIVTTLPTGQAGLPLTTGTTGVIPWMGMNLRTDNEFVVATDLDDKGNPIKVILTNVPMAQLIYTRDLSQVPDSWDALLLSAASAYLGTYLISALLRNRAQLQDQAKIAQGLIDQARAANGNEALTSIDHRPDWMSARGVGGPWPWRMGMAGQQWQPIAFPGGVSY